MTQMNGYQSQAIVTLTTTQIRVTPGVPGEQEADTITIRGHEGTVVDIPEFGFKDFKLDLSCLSNPPSPEPSLAETRHLTPSPPPPSSPSIRSISFASYPSPTPLGRSLTKRSMSRLSPVPGSSVPRGSWPLMKYVGRGTPIDRSRRIEWSGTMGDDVGEDGLLISDARPTSLDYSVRRSSQRSISPEWHDVVPSRRASTLPARSRSRTFATQSAIEKPEIKLEGLSSDNSEWSSFMQTVLSSTDSTSVTASASGSTSNLPNIPLQDKPPEDQPEFKEPLTLALSPEEVRQLDTGIEMDLGINEALDLGLGTRGGMNWFALGLLPASGRESPSVYSSAIQTPPASRPPSVSASEHRSTTSTKAGPNGVFQFKSAFQPWWKKILGKLKNTRFIGGPRQ